MPWGECTVTLEDVAYQLGLPIDDEPVNDCLWDFETHMPEGTGRPWWEWFQEMFGQVPEVGDRDACTVTFSWFKSRFGELPDGASEELVVRSLCRAANRSVIQLAGPLDLLQSWIFWRFPTLRPYGFESTRLSGHWPPDEKVPRVLHHRKQLDLMPFLCLSPVSNGCGRGCSRSFHPAGRPLGPLDFDRPTYILWDHRVAPGGPVIPQFRGVQNPPHAPLNMDFMHAKGGRGNDQWFPQTYQRWHGLWASRFAQLFGIAQLDDTGPSAVFLWWWILAARRYLVPAGLYHHFPADEILVEAT
ncbi:hypothetical protein PIB30_041849 [Stylosanthes scabra]|uniref:Aminotransferase-like plant mobile domain-containing protein n=1 Tax=Stylosanthes scabra TaxID=79078 RepID=A0ABU6TEN1_9FABA|nr:hypothetical protein [Stylosanthes scabra]